LQLLILCICVADDVYGQVRYSIPEEMVKGSFVGNIAQDLGLDIILDNPMELHRIDMEILDINDHAPVFNKKDIFFEISESVHSGAIFSLDTAKDPDVGTNSLQTYRLHPADHFNVKILSRLDGTKYVEMVLQTTLDREKQEEHKLVLTAYDGGNPQKSGSISINILVLDVNDNGPIFLQTVYKASILENSAKGTRVLQVSAVDADKGTNGEVTYSFSRGSLSDLFDINTHTGEITVGGLIDFESTKQYEINVEAKDRGGFTNSSKVIIDIIDVNDNAPVITLMSFSSPVPEDSIPGTVIAMLNIKDLDSGKNGHLKCFIRPDSPFQIKQSSSNFYILTTDHVLDREKISEYNITITAVDEGSPPYSTNKTVTLKLSDVNDNAP
ncbi:hypothetical protein Z043_124117, partial [Scleropages formosus]